MSLCFRSCCQLLLLCDLGSGVLLPGWSRTHWQFEIAAVLHTVGGFHVGGGMRISWHIL
jgi:hypothetical protein